MLSFLRRISSTTSLPDALPRTCSQSICRESIVEWSAKPRTILILKKPSDSSTTRALSTLLKSLEGFNVVLESQAIKELGDLPGIYMAPTSIESLEYNRSVDLVITLGGDGTILHASSLFTGSVPPILPFSMGTIGFLLPFDFKDHSVALNKILESRRAHVLQRMRLSCSIYEKDATLPSLTSLVMNEVVFHRGRHAQLTSLQCYTGSQMLTDVVADGLILTTPTGSTAYSLSAGGPIIHPLVPCIAVVPICPQSLSFRPMVLPSDTEFTIQLSPKSRGLAQVSADGRDVWTLHQGERVQVF